MRWIATPDEVLALETATDAERTAAVDAIEAYRTCGADHAESTGAWMLEGLAAGELRNTWLLHLAETCHEPRDHQGREPARAASEALFGFVLPTPEAARSADFFWRVAQRLS